MSTEGSGLPGEGEKPAKVVIERRVHPGGEESFTEWARRFVGAAANSSGHQGSSVLSAEGGGSRFILLRFATGTDLHQWERSPEQVALLAEADQFSSHGQVSQVRSGMETWFTVPGIPAPMSPPPRWKMALVTWCALLPMVMTLSFVLAPLHLPFPAGAMISTAIPVIMLTWVIMPRATRRLYGWLYAK